MISFKYVVCGVVLATSVAFGATSDITNARKQFLSNFASGSVVSGSTKAGNVQRWYLFNEGHLGYSYSMLGDLNLHSLDVGYSMYITAINAASGLRPYFGTEITVPIYLKSVGNSNAFLADATNLPPRGKNVMSDIGFNGWGVQVPIVLGVQANAFYVQAMVGYSYHSITDRFYMGDNLNDTSLANTYHGLTYGLGAGIKVSNVFTVGLRYVMGQLTSSERTAESGIATNVIRTKDFKDDYKRISVIFGIVF